MLNLYKYLKYIGMKNPNAHLHMSEKGKELLKHFEGVHLKAYKDPVNIPTIGYGNTFYEDGTKVKMGDVITMDRALQLLDLILPKFEKIVRSRITRPLLQHEFDALVDFVYNTGGGYKSKVGYKDYELFKNVNNNMGANGLHNYWTSCAITADGEKLNGLIRRRKAEYHLFSTGELNFFRP